MIFKIIVIGFFTLLLNLSAQDSAVKLNHYLLLPKTIEILDVINQEIKEKTNTNIAVYAISDSNEANYKQIIKEYEEENINKSYFLVVFVLDIKKIELILSGDLKKIINKETIYWDYMVPLIPQKAQELNSERISAIILNGVISFVEQLSEEKEVHFEILAELTKGNTTNNILKFIFYAMALSLLVLFIYRMKKG